MEGLIVKGTAGKENTWSQGHHRGSGAVLKVSIMWAGGLRYSQNTDNGLMH